MSKSSKLKIILGSLYLIIIFVVLWLFFSYFSISELTSYDLIKNNRNYLIEIKNSNILLSGILFFILTAIWTLLLGFASPILLLAGFIFGKWLGSLLAAFALSTGATLLYVFCNFYLKDFIKKKFLKKFIFLNEKFKKNEFNFFLIYRFVGGIPFAISNILPTLFDVKIKNFFFGSLLGMYPQIFVWTSLGSGIEKIIDQNLKLPTFIELIYSREIYLPILGFIIIMILGVVIKKIFYKS
tara:strand:+ start:2644 stop:3363 length:720 start_codon:yes stop_codon:yes gene_type:complete